MEFRVQEVAACRTQGVLLLREGPHALGTGDTRVVSAHLVVELTNAVRMYGYRL